ncbi:uncharacterized protein LOC118188618, partial [Stegodyphus dumicola]|uniref:uncharacterized protein LOC118188618 n=1 Tax=Stegodyphus dumicola TaxID=202533 RepID=UPI0015AE3743
FLLLLILSVSLVIAAPLYGEDGGYTGHASYVPLKKSLEKFLSRTESHSDDSIHTSAGSPELTKRPSKQIAPLLHEDKVVPKVYDVAQYAPTYQHGYGNNKITAEVPSAPYAKATLYGPSSGGHKIADAYQNQYIDSPSDKEHDYKEDYLSYPQPYEYGYALKDEHGNVQHKKESSDGHGNVRGTYGFTDEHGLYRSVEYVADKGGFRASIKTNEPGTENQDPADVHLEVEHPKY